MYFYYSYISHLIYFWNLKQKCHKLGNQKNQIRLNVHYINYSSKSTETSVTRKFHSSFPWGRGWFPKNVLKIFFQNSPSLTIQVLFTNNRIKLNTTKNTYYKHMPLILLKNRILFINKKISLINFLLKKNYLIFKVQRRKGRFPKNVLNVFFSPK